MGVKIISESICIAYWLSPYFHWVSHHLSSFPDFICDCCDPQCTVHNPEFDRFCDSFVLLWPCTAYFEIKLAPLFKCPSSQNLLDHIICMKWDTWNIVTMSGNRFIAVKNLTSLLLLSFLDGLIHSCMNLVHPRQGIISTFFCLDSATLLSQSNSHLGHLVSYEVMFTPNCMIWWESLIFDV